VNNPATGEIIAHVPFMGKIEAQKAIAAASIAFQRE
jgi:acyl-CoA reductase-like NAD-dependent aldehyde dehydrogenase